MGPNLSAQNLSPEEVQRIMSNLNLQKLAQVDPAGLSQIVEGINSASRFDLPTALAQRSAGHKPRGIDQSDILLLAQELIQEEYEVELAELEDLVELAELEGWVVI